MATTRWCGTCGTQIPEGARFCGNCGTAAPAAAIPAGSTSFADGTAAPVTGGRQVAADSPDPRPAGRADPFPQQGQAAQYPLPSGGPAAVAATAGAEGSRWPAEATGTSGSDGSHGSHGSHGSVPAPGSAAGAPWARPGEPGGGPTSGRESVDALLGGDWAGAALASLAALVSMAVLGLIALLLAGAADGGTHLVISGTAMAVCAALGGDLFARGTGTFADEASFGVLPLSLTFLGLTVLAVLFLLRTRRSTPQETLFQVARTTLAFAALTFVLALISRLHTDDQQLDFDGRLGASAGSALLGAALFAVAALGTALFLIRPAVLPARLQAVRASCRAALLAAVAVFVVGLAAVVGGLVYTLVTEDDKLDQLAAAVLFMPNLALGSVLLTMGVPLHGGGELGTIGSEFGSGGDSVTLLTLTEQSAWWWAAPVVLAAVLVAVTVVVVLRQHTLPGARFEALRVAGCYALLAFLAALLLRVAVSGNSGILDQNGSLSASFNPVVSALVAGLWGLAAAVAAPQVATAIGRALVSGVRRRFGAAPLPQPLAPPPHPQPEYGP